MATLTTISGDAERMRKQSKKEVKHPKYERKKKIAEYSTNYFQNGKLKTNRQNSNLKSQTKYPKQTKIQSHSKLSPNRSRITVATLQ